MTIGSYIKEQRHARGLSQQEVAGAVGIDISYLSKIENDRLGRTPSVKTLIGLAAALGVSTLEVLELAGKVPQAFGASGQGDVALRFLVRASELISDDAGWQDLLSYIENKYG